MSYNFVNEDSENRTYSFGDKINIDRLRSNYSKSPFFSYIHIDLNKTEYNFKQSCLDNKDIIAYFEIVKSFSKQTIDDLINSNYKSHFHFYHSPKGKLLELLKKISGKDYFKPEETPSIGQFALYTDSKKADRIKGIKSPRIFFMLGERGVFYILFYDPYHEIKPQNM